MNGRLVWFVLVLVLCCLAFDGNCGKNSPLPAKLLNASTVYVDPLIIGCPDTCADDVYRELADWNRLKLVTEEREADLVFQFTGTTEVVRMQGTGDPSYTYAVHFNVLDAKTGECLWRSSRERGIVTPKPARDLMKELRSRIDAQRQQKT